MKYSDETGFEISIPRRKNESVIEHITTCSLILADMLAIRQRHLNKNTCGNPIVKMEGNNG